MASNETTESHTCVETQFKYKCEGCNVLFCESCKSQHENDLNSRNHKIISAEKVTTEMQKKMEDESKHMTTKMENMTKRIKMLESDLETVHGIETEAVKKVANIRESCIQEVNEHFDEVETKIRAYAQRHRIKIRRELRKLSANIQALQDQIDVVGSCLTKENNAMMGRVNDVMEQAKECLLLVDEQPMEIEAFTIEVEKEEFSMILPKVFLKLGNEDTNKELCKERDSKPLCEVSKKTWKEHTTHVLPMGCTTIRLMKSNIYCCLDKGISIFNKDLVPVASFSSGEMTHIRDVVAYSYSDLIIASDKGLYHTTSKGEILQCISAGEYTSVVMDGCLVVAANKKGDIQMFDSSKSWKQCGVFQPLCSSTSHWITVGVLGHNIVSCCQHDNTVRISSKDGLWSFQRGTNGKELGELTFPFVCQIDREGTILVADYSNQRLQTIDSNGKWASVPDVRGYARSALYEGTRLYTLTRSKTLSIYTCNLEAENKA